jgi:hypothetical protein
MQPPKTTLISVNSTQKALIALWLAELAEAMDSDKTLVE